MVFHLPNVSILSENRSETQYEFRQNHKPSAAIFGWKKKYGYDMLKKEEMEGWIWF